MIHRNVAAPTINDLSEFMKTHFDFDCAIIGGGPGGLVSALYLERYKRKIIVIDAGESRAQWAPRIRNLIGYIGGIKGTDLLSKLRHQVHSQKSESVRGTAILKRINGGFEVKIENRTVTAKKVILATGMLDVQPPVPNFADLRKKAVLGYCPICDGFDHRDDPIGLLVKDVHGLRKIKFIARFSPLLHVIPTVPLKVSPQYIKIIRETGVHFHVGQLESLTFQRNPRGLVVKIKGQKPFYLKFAYVELGTKVSHTAIKHINGLKKTRDGFIVTSSHQETSVSGLFAVGDCVHALSQVSVAIGHAAVAATQVHNDLGF
jgi:thioredoxin reductase (NADPH)